MTLPLTLPDRIPLEPPPGDPATVDDLPRRLASVRLALIVSLFRRVRRRQWDRIRLILRLLRDE